MKQIVEARREKRLRIAEIRVRVLEANRGGTKRNKVKKCQKRLRVLEANRRDTKRNKVKKCQKKVNDS